MDPPGQQPARRETLTLDVNMQAYSAEPRAFTVDPARWDKGLDVALLSTFSAAASDFGGGEVRIYLGLNGGVPASGDWRLHTKAARPGLPVAVCCLINTPPRTC